MSTTAKDAIDKIKKLQALASDKGATEGEIANALKAITALMARHGIEADALAEKPKIQRGEYQSAKNFEGTLASAAGLLYGCKLIFEGPRALFVGRTENIEAAEITSRWLIKQVLALGRAGAASVPVNPGWVGGIGNADMEWQTGRAKWRRDFNRGCAARVHARAAEIARDLKSMAEATGQTALVVENHFKTLARENEQFATELFGKLSKRRFRPVYASAGANAGWQAGEKVSLNKNIR